MRWLQVNSMNLSAVCGMKEKTRHGHRKAGFKMILRPGRHEDELLLKQEIQHADTGIHQQRNEEDVNNDLQSAVN